MPNKAYAILYAAVDEDSGYLYFPIKRNNLVYGGMPQFFGGTKNDNESDRDTIAREMAEESDQQITLLAGGLTRIHSGKVGESTYNFYVAQNFSGMHFLGKLKNLEMASIEKFLVQLGGDSDVEDLLQRLKIIPSEAFTESETYTAFDKAIRWAEGG